MWCCLSTVVIRCIIQRLYVWIRCPKDIFTGSLQVGEVHCNRYSRWFNHYIAVTTALVAVSARTLFLIIPQGQWPHVAMVMRSVGYPLITFRSRCWCAARRDQYRWWMLLYVVCTMPPCKTSENGLVAIMNVLACNIRLHANQLLWWIWILLILDVTSKYFSASGSQYKENCVWPALEKQWRRKKHAGNKVSI